VLSDPLPNFLIHARILRLPCGQAIHMAVVHAERRGDQNRIVDFLVGRATLPGLFDILRRDVLAALLVVSQFENVSKGKLRCRRGAFPSKCVRKAVQHE
jgi:hypothetical protein